MIIVTVPIGRDELRERAIQRFGNLVKAVVDLKKRVMVIGGDLHSDEEAMLLEQGSRQSDLWGINLYPHLEGDDFIEFDSLINLRPSQGNMSRGIDDLETQKRIRGVVMSLVK